MRKTRDPVQDSTNAADTLRAALRAAAVRRHAADVEQAAAAQALNEMVLAAHDARTIPVGEVLELAGMKRSWFYQLRDQAKGGK